MQQSGLTRYGFVMATGMNTGGPAAGITPALSHHRSPGHLLEFLVSVYLVVVAALADPFDTPESGRWRVQMEVLSTVTPMAVAEPRESQGEWWLTCIQGARIV